MRRVIPVLLCALVGCPNPEQAPPDQGTSVGNPGKGVSRIAPGEGLETLEADATMAWAAVSCDGGAVPVGALEATNLIESQERSWPPGSWCALTVELDGPLRFIGDAGEVEPQLVDLTLQIESVLTLWATDTIEVDETSYVLELGAPAWVDTFELPLEEADLVVTPEEETRQLHDALTLALIEGTALYLDDDDDGLLSPAERDAGPVAEVISSPPPGWEPPVDTGTPAADEDGRLSSEGCNCSTPGAPAAGLWLLLLAPVLTRRRRRE